MNKQALFEAIYKANYARLFSVAQQMLGDAEVARDFVGDTFEYAWTHFDENSLNTCVPLLFAFIRSRCIDYLRHQNVHENYIEYIQYVTDEQDESDYLKREERSKEVHRVLNLLPERVRIIFVKCYVERKHYAEVAEELGISQNTVKKAIMRALATFRQEIRQN